MNDVASTASLHSPLKVGSITLKNRIALGPMAVLAAESDGRPSAQTIAFLEARAKGGVGLVIVGGSTGTERAATESNFAVLNLSKEEYLPDLRRVAAAVHAHGVPIISEMNSGLGRMGLESKCGELISASPIKVVMRRNRFPKGILSPADVSLPMPRAATVEPAG